jgi:glutamine amidotransferase
MTAIIDYGAGNLRSVQKAFEHLGEQAVITRDRDAILSADAAVLPGVGAFGDAMDSLNRRELAPVIREFIATGKPFLGICLGLQLLFDKSEESPGVQGLGILRGTVRRFPKEIGLKIPHIGFNSIRKSPPCPLFAGLPDEPYYYFVHSYYCRCDDRAASAAETEYGIRFDSAVQQGNLFAVQFHPEKSGTVGLRTLQNFIGLVGDSRKGE